MPVLQEIKVPQESVNDETLLVLDLFFKTGDKIKPGTIIAELETSKTAVTVEATEEGYVQYFCKAGDELPVNAIIARVLDEAPSADEVIIASSLTKANPLSSEETAAGESIFSKTALELLEKYGIARDKFKGKGFVGKKEVEMYVNPARGDIQNINRPVGYVVSEPLVNDESKVELKKLSSYKKKEIAYLSSVQSASLVSTVNVTVETNGVREYLNMHLKYLKNSLLPVMIYETGRLLKKYPELNSYYNDGYIAYYNEVNVGFAADMEKGLKVLNIRDANKKSMSHVEEEILQLSNDYLDNKLKAESLADITFTITDLSAENIFSFTPLINMKNAAILGISGVDEQFNRCMLSLSFDHRVTEGRNAAMFLSELKTRIESYTSAGMEETVRNKKLTSYRCYKCYKTLLEDLSNTGFVKCITPIGQEGFICQSCFQGF